jgi:redox-sensitive bicupin YhaK (pirin superfamily)
MLDLVIDQRRKDLGGFEVGRVLPFAKRRMVGPFIFFDHMGPVDMPANIPRSVDVRPHPHIGLSTVTYLLAGEMTHRDSTGAVMDIRPGEVNWMTAGRGITHSERFDRLRAAGGRMHGLQSWVALPTEMEETDPGFDHYGAADLPTGDEAGVWWRLIAGTAYGAQSRVRTHSPMFYLHVDLQPGAGIALPAEHRERAAYVVEGEVEAAGDRHGSGRMLVFTAGTPAHVTAVTASTVMLLGGDPLGERFIEWNFVSSSKERIEQAKADWRAGRIKLPDADNAEFIPLPEPPPRPNPMS